MNKVAKGAAVAGILLVVLLAGIFSTQWEDVTEYQDPQPLPTFPTDGDDSIWDGDELKEESLSFTVFEKYGVILIPLAVLMFGAMIAGVVISREEIER